MYFHRHSSIVCSRLRPSVGSSRSDEFVLCATGFASAVCAADSGPESATFSVVSKNRRRELLRCLPESNRHAFASFQDVIPGRHSSVVKNGRQGFGETLLLRSGQLSYTALSRRGRVRTCNLRIQCSSAGIRPLFRCSCSGRGYESPKASEHSGLVASSTTVKERTRQGLLRRYPTWWGSWDKDVVPTAFEFYSTCRPVDLHVAVCIERASRLSQCGGSVGASPSRVCLYLGPPSPKVCWTERLPTLSLSHVKSSPSRSHRPSDHRFRLRRLRRSGRRPCH